MGEASGEVLGGGERREDGIGVPQLWWAARPPLLRKSA